MQKKKCTQCGNSFEAKRADSLYCSNNCKQKAHHKRSVEKKETIVDAEKPIFYFDEWENICSDTGIDFITFCFIRKNITANDKKTLANYIYSFIENGNEDAENRFGYLKKTNAYKIFEEKFLNGEFEIIAEKEQPKEV